MIFLFFFISFNYISGYVKLLRDRMMPKIRPAARTLLWLFFPPLNYIKGERKNKFCGVRSAGRIFLTRLLLDFNSPFYLHSLHIIIIKRIAAMVIALSARLKTGQKCKSIKSVTVPKSILSIRFPVAPPKMREKGILYSVGIFL